MGVIKKSFQLNHYSGTGDCQGWRKCGKQVGVCAACRNDANFANPKPLPKGSRVFKASSLSLQTLTAAALILPGLLQPPAQAADDDEVAFQYSHYQEGRREMFGLVSQFNPIEVESVHGGGKFTLTDRVKFAFNYTQDTWGGATPIATLPQAFNGNHDVIDYSISPDTKVGASPYLSPGYVVFDKNLQPVQRINDPNGIGDFNGAFYRKNNQLVHTLSMASPEVRKQGDFKLSYEWDESALDIGGGVSIEDDYESQFGNINTRWDFNQKQTTLNVGLSYTHSRIHSILDHDAWPYFHQNEKYDGLAILEENGGTHLIEGTKQDWSAQMGLTHVLNKNAMLEASLGYTRSTGYMENPYKAVNVAFIDPNQQDPNTSCAEAAIGLVCGNIAAVMEQRPDERNQWSGGLRYVQHIEPLDAATHLGYRVFSDDWGITSHTLDADWVQPMGQGWTVTPRIRYYSQDAADFYTPYLFSPQGEYNNVIDDKGRQVMLDNNSFDPEKAPHFFFDPNTGQYFDEQNNDVTDAYNNGELSLYNQTQLFDRKKLPQHFSSDHRLSGYGALSGGVTLSKQFAKGVSLDLDFEYYTHQGSLKIGGGGEGNYADFDYWTANAALKVDLAALSFNSGTSHHSLTNHHHTNIPAGVIFGHMLPKAGDMMVGYRYQWSSQGGAMLNGLNAVDNPSVIAGGCAGNPCYMTPDSMTMHMHMLDLMVAPTDWLTLMLMPQFMDMNMSLRGLSTEFIDLGHNLNGHYGHHVQNGHETGGIGDLGMYALFKVLDGNSHHLQVTAGFSAPTGDVDIQMRRNHQTDGGFIHYGMQLGSGTWDFKPSITYSGQIEQVSWGAQASGTLRMEDQNKSGYKLGDIFQATAWGGYNLTPWLTASVRGVYTTQGGIEGEYPGAHSDSANLFINADGSPTSILKFGPMDYPQNYGGKYGDVGFGLSASVPSGNFAGNGVSVEWLQPVYTNVNGYQLDRDGMLSFTWSYGF
ncbi:MAG: DUF3570 domain-containing protein [Methyloglobulus sp.]